MKTMHSVTRRRVIQLAAAGLASLHAGLHAQSYPARPPSALSSPSRLEVPRTVPLAFTGADLAKWAGVVKQWGAKVG